MTTENDRLGDVNGVLWWIGWHPLIVTVAGLPLLLVGGLVLWLVGLTYVNANHAAVREDYVDLVHRRRTTYAENTDPEAEVHTLVGSTPSGRWYSPPEEYTANHLLVGRTSVTVVGGVRLKLPTRMPYVRDDRREVFYDQISSVTYSEPHLTIATTDGETLRYVSGRTPDDALQDLQSRLRAYKTNA